MTMMKMAVTMRMVIDCDDYDIDDDVDDSNNDDDVDDRLWQL